MIGLLLGTPANFVPFGHSHPAHASSIQALVPMRVAAERRAADMGISMHSAVTGASRRQGARAIGVSSATSEARRGLDLRPCRSRIAVARRVPCTVGEAMGPSRPVSE